MASNGKISIHVEYAFQVSAMIGVKEENIVLEKTATLDDLIDVIQHKYASVKNFQLRGKYFTIFDENGRIFNINTAKEHPVTDGEHYNIEILNLDGG